MIAVVWNAGPLAEALECRLIGDAGVQLNGVAPIEEATPSQITFLANPKYRRYLTTTSAGGIIVSPKMPTPGNLLRFESDNPYLTFRRALELFYPGVGSWVEEGIHPSAVIDPTAMIGDNARIGPFVHIEADAVIGHNFTAFSGAYVGRGVRVGDDVILGIHATLRHDVFLGDRVVIADGAVIGFDGFGYAPSAEGFLKIPQVGTVEIADDVEIGANTCIDRATIGSTRIGRGTKLDNLIQIAHGVHIGENTVIAAQTGISGSTTIGSQVMIGGQAGFAGHIELGDGMMVGAQAGVTKDWDIKSFISGYPARAHSESLRIEASTNQLPELLKRVKALEEELSKLKA